MAMKNWKAILVSVCKVRFFSNALCNYAQITSSLFPRHMWTNQIIGVIKKNHTRQICTTQEPNFKDSNLRHSVTYKFKGNSKMQPFSQT